MSLPFNTLQSYYHLACWVAPPGSGPFTDETTGNQNSAYKDVSQYIDTTSTANQLQVTQAWGRQGDTATIPLTFEYTGNNLSGSFEQQGQQLIGQQITFPLIIKPLSPIVLVAPTGDIMFAGLVTNPKLNFQGPNLWTWVCECSDYTFYANSAIINTAYSSDIPMDDAIVDMVVAANCGIKAATVANGGYVHPCPSLPFIQFSFQTLTQALQQTVTQVSQSAQYGWRIDENLNLHFYNQYQAPEAVALVTDDSSYGVPAYGNGPGGYGNSGYSYAPGGYFINTAVSVQRPYLCHLEVDTMQMYEFDATQLYNQIWVMGTSINQPVQTKGAPTDAWLGDGSTTSFALRYPVLQADSSQTYIGIQALLLVGGVPYEVGLLSFQQGTPVTTPWVIVQHPDGSWYLQTNAGTAAPAAGANILLWYSYTIPNVAIVTDEKSVRNYHHTFAKVVNDSTIISVNEAYTRADMELTEYSIVEENLTAYTTEEFVGHFNAGDVLHVVLKTFPDSLNGYILGLDDTFIVTSNTIMMLTTGYRQYQFKAMRIKPSIVTPTPSQYNL